jgi:hypothetical protein
MSNAEWSVVPGATSVPVSRTHGNSLDTGHGRQMPIGDAHRADQLRTATSITASPPFDRPGWVAFYRRRNGRTLAPWSELCAPAGFSPSSPPLYYRNRTDLTSAGLYLASLVLTGPVCSPSVSCSFPYPSCRLCLPLRNPFELAVVVRLGPHL